MKVRVVRLDAVGAQPWRNGGGVTRELLAWPSAQHWSIRVSVADIDADGAFSRFADTQRWFAVIDGDGVELTIDGDRRCVRRGDAPLDFSGEAMTDCRLLDGPTRDLNLMLRDARGRLQRIDNGSLWRPEASQCGLFAATAGRCTAGSNVFDIEPGCLLWFDRAPEELLFTSTHGGGQNAGWWIAATPSESGR